MKRPDANDCDPYFLLYADRPPEGDIVETPRKVEFDRLRAELERLQIAVKDAEVSLAFAKADEDAVYLPLKQGANELVLAVSEVWMGWGFIARLEDIEGLRIE